MSTAVVDYDYQDDLRGAATGVHTNDSWAVDITLRSYR